MNAGAVASSLTAGMGEEVSSAPLGEGLRANTYSLLGALLAAPPSHALIDLLKRITPAEAGAEGELAPAWEVLRLAAERASVASLDDEYHELFIGIGRGELVPYGSWYMTGFLMDQPLAVLRRDLAELGFARQEDIREPEDHAAALLETMGMLAADSDVSVEIERRFFQSHMGPWMKTFFLDLQKAEAARFYRSVGQFGEQFMEFEHKYLTMLV
ncbi:MAG: molecular chaperone [Gammaproteobacteria bacterium]|nr:molecular chaperone [Gammaproteobacteria bacterium]NIO26378.1 molecular chaperone [Gammaproteobacteria bacterium]NIO66930.1 molecular chaperone [Gammaproteobacteria bacterium]NIP44940.1 molecular chaperone [Gammaproteobacteria bacterium]NIP66139.1 molecular chaperone [Gammaproteobacteria bacterium]